MSSRKIDPTNEAPRPTTATRAHLERGFRFEQGGTLHRALEAYADALAADPTREEEIDARLRIARVYRTKADFARSLEEAREAVRLAMLIGADDLAAEAMNVEVGILQTQGLLDDADRLALRAIGLARSPRVRGITLQNLGRGAAERREFATSDRYFEQSIAAFRQAGYELGLVFGLVNAARAAFDRGDPGRSLIIGEEAISIARRLNALDLLLTAVQNQAAALVVLGKLDAAEALLTEALGHFTSAKNPLRQAECLEIIGELSESRSDLGTAARCYTRALDLAKAANDQRLIDRATQRLDAVRSPGGRGGSGGRVRRNGRG